MKVSIQFDAELRLAPDIEQRNAERVHFAQTVLDNEVLKRLRAYVPYNTGTLYNSLFWNTVPGEGLIHQGAPYARYLYYGEVYGPNYPIIEGGQLVGFFTNKDGKRCPLFKGGQIIGFYSPKHKEPTGRQLHYNNGGSHWFDKMVAADSEVLLEATQRALDGGNS
jgi:hypothetical protein